MRQVLFVEDDATRLQGVDSGHTTASGWWQRHNGKSLSESAAGGIFMDDFDSTSVLFNFHSCIYLLSYAADGDNIYLVDEAEVVAVIQRYLSVYAGEIYLYRPPAKNRRLVSRGEIEMATDEELPLPGYEEVTADQVWELILASLQLPKTLKVGAVCYANQLRRFELLENGWEGQD